jgi:CheY-like chemotaxis protein
VPQTLLLADDSVTIQRVIELTFADEDINVVAVSDGDQAIARLDAMPPDIVLVDAGMPGKSGYEVAAYVKQTPKLAHIPVVLLTGAFEPVDEARATAAGCDGVLAKPFEPQMVIGRVKELLSRTAPAASPGLMDDIFNMPPPQAAAHATELWPAPAREQTTDEPAVGSKKIDDYFDQLDAAFTNLAGKPSEVTDRPAPAMSAELDWFGLQPAGKTDETPESAPPGQPFWTHEADLLIAPASEPEQRSAPEETHAPEQQRAPQEPPPAEPYVSVQPAPSPSPMPAMTSEAPPQPPPAPSAISLPPLADAFAELLDAEQREPAPAVRPAWPSTARSGQAVSDDLVEQISRRVIEQLTDRVVREAVAEIAERLVREEIERIKSSIQ